MNKFNVLATAFLASTLSFSALADVDRKFSETYDFSKSGEVRLENINGDIEIVGWDSDKIQFEYTAKADDKDDLDRIEVIVGTSKNNFSAEVEFKKKKSSWFGGWGGSSGTVDFRLKVPHSVALELIESVNGDVSIDEVHGEIRAETVNGKIIVEDADGDVKVDTVNGKIKIVMKGFSDDQRITADSVNGDIVVYLPENQGFRLTAETINGDLSNDFGIKVIEGTYVGADMEGSYKSGGGRLNFDTVNGDISVKKD